MEEIIEKLFEIEDVAVKVMEDTMVQKKELAESMDEKIKRFDKKVKEDTEKKLTLYAKECNEQSLKKLKQLEEQTNEIKINMDEIYKNHHKEIAYKLFEAVIKE